MFDDLTQFWPRASASKPIVMFGAGSIVTDARQTRSGDLLEAKLANYARSSWPRRVCTVEP